MLETTNPRSSIPVETYFLWKLKTFESLGPEETFGFFFSFLKALSKVSDGPGNFFPGVFFFVSNFYNLLQKTDV